MSQFRLWLRRVLPLSLRQAVSQMRRRMRDARNGVRLSAVHSDANLNAWVLQAELRQPIMAGVLFANKLANLRHGAQCVNRAQIAPGETWSFWRYVNKPSARNGFVPGRNLVNGQLVGQVGGGLCQLSSLIYHLGLLAGLNVVERHPHSIDIYHEHERFTPLGADATVVWGAKDLRLMNPHDVEVILECVVQEHFLVGRAYARSKLPDYDVSFVRKQLDARHAIVDTLVNARQHTQTSYRQEQGMGLQRS
ncbi:MAG TPA: VanW family protein [Rhodocyclaceae bacterium]|nr:VanW family protein [Rhodocyclaceae bacterium]